jgi:hypothetical protein
LLAFWTFYTDSKNVHFTIVKRAPIKVLLKKTIFLGHGQFFILQNSFLANTFEKITEHSACAKEEIASKSHQNQGLNDLIIDFLLPSPCHLPTQMGSFGDAYLTLGHL